MSATLYLDQDVYWEASVSPAVPELLWVGPSV